MKVKISVIALLLVLSAAAGFGDSFFRTPDAGRDFFGKPKSRPLPASPTVPGAPADGTDAASDAENGDFYDLAFLIGAQPCLDLFDTGNMGVFVGGNIQWSPVEHLGLGLRIGAHPFRPYIAAFTEKGGGNYQYYEDYITIAGDNTNPEYVSTYYFMGYDSLLFNEVQFELFYFTGSNGLEGFYAGAEAGFLVNGRQIEAYTEYNHDEPVQHIDENGNLTGEGVLPTYSMFSLRGGPLIGYKLVLSGFTIDIAGGYAFSNNPLFSGLRIGLKTGYSFRG